MALKIPFNGQYFIWTSLCQKSRHKSHSSIPLILSKHSPSPLMLEWKVVKRKASCEAHRTHWTLSDWADNIYWLCHPRGSPTRSKMQTERGHRQGDIGDECQALPRAKIPTESQTLVKLQSQKHFHAFIRNQKYPSTKVISTHKSVWLWYKNGIKTILI